jgi:starch synthase (maltosyl-transferring)
VKSDHPDVLVLAVASARPKVMDRLARLGFTWIRRERDEAPLPEPDLWRPLAWVAPGGEDFSQRLVQAATQAASFGVSQIPDSASDLRELRDLITKLNTIRRENPALQSDQRLRFLPTDNDRVLCFSRMDAKGTNVLLVAINLDPVEAQSAWLELPGEELGLPRDQPFPVYDLLSGARYLWHGTRSFVQLAPRPIPALIFRLRGRRGNDRR